MNTEDAPRNDAAAGALSAAPDAPDPRLGGPSEEPCAHTPRDTEGGEERAEARRDTNDAAPCGTPRDTSDGAAPCDDPRGAGEVAEGDDPHVGRGDDGGQEPHGAANEDTRRDAQGTAGARIGQGLSIVGRALGRAAVGAGAAIARGARAIDPDLVRFAAQAPLMGLTHLSAAAPAPERLPDDGQRLVVFVHGLGGHRGNFLPMRCYFELMGRQRCASVGFEDTSTVAAMADQLVAFILDLIDLNGLSPPHTDGDPPPPAPPVVDLVCHSMGGVVARAALEDPRLAGRVAHLVTMGTPHHGTELARLARTEKIVDLRPGSDLLGRLAAQIPWDSDALPPLTCLWSRSDLVILPPEAARVDGADNIEIKDATHLSYLLHPRVWQQILTDLAPTAAP